MFLTGEINICLEQDKRTLNLLSVVAQGNLLLFRLSEVMVVALSVSLSVRVSVSASVSIVFQEHVETQINMSSFSPESFHQFQLPFLLS